MALLCRHDHASVECSLSSSVGGCLNRSPIHRCDAVESWRTRQMLMVLCLPRLPGAGDGVLWSALEASQASMKPTTETLPLCTGSGRVLCDYGSHARLAAAGPGKARQRERWTAA